MADKTYVPGVDDEMSSDNQRTSSANDAERRSPFASATGGGTVIPDSDGSDFGGRRAADNASSKGKPVLGFLYSVSKTNFGEYWPLYLGANTIGRNKACDVQLLEGTVSDEHACLIIHKEDDGEVYAGLQDKGSTHGVKINGKSIHFDIAGCKNMDIIKIGKCYELLFVLIDASSLNLAVSENFIEVKSSPKHASSRIMSGGNGGLNSRIANPSSSDRTHAMDGEVEISGGTRTR